MGEPVQRAKERKVSYIFLIFFQQNYIIFSVFSVFRGTFYDDKGRILDSNHNRHLSGDVKESDKDKGQANNDNVPLNKSEVPIMNSEGEILPGNKEEAQE